jgi:hypothetical protein
MFNMCSGGEGDEYMSLQIKLPKDKFKGNQLFVSVPTKLK